MEWLTCIRKAIDYIENHLNEEIHVQDVADHVYISPFFLQRGFSVMTGYGIGEYIRSRRLSEAGRDMENTDAKVIDLALKYGYETPEAFTKAFTRFHNASPSAVRNHLAKPKTFFPLKISLSVTGGSEMDYTVRKMFPFKVIGFERIFSQDTSYQEIPAFWDEMNEKYMNHVYAGNEPANPFEKAVIDNGIGEYGICIDDIGEERFRYLIAGKYTGGEVPEGMKLYEFERGEWAVFSCTGPLPEALQSINTRIFREWLPGNPEYELCGNANVEWYDCMNGSSSDPGYHSAIWIPVRRKQRSRK